MSYYVCDVTSLLGTPVGATQGGTECGEFHSSHSTLLASFVHADILLKGRVLVQWSFSLMVFTEAHVSSRCQVAHSDTALLATQEKWQAPSDQDG